MNISKMRNNNYKLIRQDLSLRNGVQLNNNSKSITKIYADILNMVLPSLVNDEQSYYLDELFIGQNIRFLGRGASPFCQVENKPRILLSIDVERYVGIFS